MKKRSKKQNRSQQALHKPLRKKDLHPLLVCDIQPDVRPFKWPRRPKVRDGPTYVQLELFAEFDGFFKDLDELEG